MYLICSDFERLFINIFLLSACQMKPCNNSHFISECKNKKQVTMTIPCERCIRIFPVFAD